LRDSPCGFKPSGFDQPIFDLVKLFPTLDGDSKIDICGCAPGLNTVDVMKQDVSRNRATHKIAELHLPNQPVYFAHYGEHD
jgi:hypothetical protein